MCDIMKEFEDATKPPDPVEREPHPMKPLDLDKVAMGGKIEVVNPSQPKNSLAYTEMFNSIQGEGRYTGRPCLFVRLHNCNMSCTWCDTAYARRLPRLWVHINGIYREMFKKHLSLIVFTGGEPLLQQNESMYRLLHRLYRSNIDITFETNGTIAPTPELLRYQPLLTVSPKPRHSQPKGSKFVETWWCAFAKYSQTDWKFVIAEQRDYDWFLECLAYINPHQQIYLHPNWTVKTLKDREDYIQYRAKWVALAKMHSPNVAMRNVHLGVQLHKILNVQ